MGPGAIISAVVYKGKFKFHSHLFLSFFIGPDGCLAPGETENKKASKSLILIVPKMNLCTCCADTGCLRLKSSLTDTFPRELICERNSQSKVGSKEHDLNSSLSSAVAMVLNCSSWSWNMFRKRNFSFLSWTHSRVSKKKKTYDAHAQTHKTLFVHVHLHATLPYIRSKRRTWCVFWKASNMLIPAVFLFNSSK